MIKVKGDEYMQVTNHKQVEDTYMTKGVVSQILSQVQMKDVMYKHTPGRAVLKAIMSGFFIGIMTVFMLVVKAQLTGLNEGVVNLIGAISFSLALVLIVLTNAELLTSNFSFLTMGYYYKAINLGQILKIVVYCLVFNLVGAIIVFGLMTFTPIINSNVVDAITKVVTAKTVDSTWYHILVKGIFCNFYINIAILMSLQFKDGLTKAFFLMSGVTIFVFMGYDHIVFNTGLFAGMLFYNAGDADLLHIFKNLVFSFIGNYIGGGIFVGLVYAYLNGKRDQYITENK